MKGPYCEQVMLSGLNNLPLSKTSDLKVNMLIVYFMLVTRVSIPAMNGHICVIMKQAVSAKAWLYWITPAGVVKVKKK